MDFPTALKECLTGKAIRNCNWNGKGMFVFKVEEKDNGEYKKLPFLMMKNANDELVPWLISPMDVFSNMWEVLE
jgi:hypothetical protein